MRKTTLNIRLLLVLLIALVLTILPMPHLLVALRPPWIFLFVLYVQFYLPSYFKVTFIFLIGLCLDVLLSTVIGEHAFAMLLTTWLVSGKARRFNFFTMGQQMALIMPFCLIYQFIILLIDAFIGYHYDPLMTVCSAVISMLLWPWIKLLGDSFLLVKLRYR